MAIIKNSRKYDIKFCYSIGDEEDEIFINVRHLIHNSKNHQKCEDVVRFISNYAATRTFDSNVKCASVTNQCDIYASHTNYLSI